MATLMSRTVLLATLVLVAAPLVPAQKRPPRKDAGARTSYVLVQVGQELRIIGSAELSSLKKEVDAAHKEAMASWTEQKRAARKAKEKFTTRKPAKPKVRKVGGPYRTELDAQKAMNKARASRTRPARVKAGEGWSLVQVGAERRVVKRSEMAALRKSVAADHRVALKAWKDARAAAKKAKEKFTEKMPAQPGIKEIRAFPTEDEARRSLEQEKG